MQKATPENFEFVLAEVVDKITDKVKKQVRSRAVRASRELKNVSNDVLRGERHGRRYKVPGTYGRQKDKVTGKYRNGVYYTASAPREPPANRTGLFRLSWKPKSYTDNGESEMTVHAMIESDYKAGKYLLGDILEESRKDGKMAPRPYKQVIIDKAKPQIEQMFKEPYV